MATLRGADLLARSIARAGVRRVFTLSGNHIMPVFDAALDAQLELVGRGPREVHALRGDHRVPRLRARDRSGPRP
jgi:hypothetical protein